MGALLLSGAVEVQVLKDFSHNSTDTFLPNVSYLAKGLKEKWLSPNLQSVYTMDLILRQSELPVYGGSLVSSQMLCILQTDRDTKIRQRLLSTISQCQVDSSKGQRHKYFQNEKNIQSSSEPTQYPASTISILRGWSHLTRLKPSNYLGVNSLRPFTPSPLDILRPWSYFARLVFFSYWKYLKLCPSESNETSQYFQNEKNIQSSWFLKLGGFDILPTKLSGLIIYTAGDLPCGAVLFLYSVKTWFLSSWS